MKFARAAGILLHPTSLPGPFGIGGLGPEAYRFVDFLAAAGQRIWQVLPLGPTGYGDSPYQSLSAFAGNPLLISPEKLVEHGYLDRAEALENFPEEQVDFGRVIPFKFGLLRRAFARFRGGSEYEEFCVRNRAWLDDFARFLALKNANDGKTWTDWTRIEADPAEIAAHKFWQYEFFRQWAELKEYCGARGVRVLGDIPIYAAHDSADVWANPELFELDERGRATKMSGVPPDYFSATGQLWGNPVYRWERLRETGYAWWIERFRAVLGVVDMVRLDHFRGFEAYWEVPAGETTAVNGRWVKGPGPGLFEAVEAALGRLPIIAENLGVITQEVEALRERFSFPGMSILQFAFGTDPQAASFRPHNYVRELVAYTGTHDNDTTVGWWSTAGAGDSTRSQAEVERERRFTLAYLGGGGGAAEIHWAFLRTLAASIADTVIAPAQDVLGLGSEARMNTPATTRGNWTWRMRPGALTEEMAARLRELAVLYDR